jgi:hypothetical protein
MGIQQYFSARNFLTGVISGLLALRVAAPDSGKLQKIHFTGRRRKVYYSTKPGTVSSDHITIMKNCAKKLR